MVAGSFTLEQLGELTGEFRAKFGADHMVSLIHDPEGGYGIYYGTDRVGGDTRKITTINAVEPPIAEAVFKYGRAIAAHIHAMSNNQVAFKDQEEVETQFGTIVGKDHADACGRIMQFLISTTVHAWTMTRHDHAADYTRFELVKFACLQKTVADLPALSIIARAHVKVAADAYNVDVNSADVTAGMSLGIDDLAVLKAAKKLLRNVRRQGMSGSTIDIKGDIGGLADAVRAQLLP